MQVQKEKKNFSWLLVYVAVVQKRAKKCAKKRDARVKFYFVYKTYCFFTFSLPSVSLDLKVPNMNGQTRMTC